MELFHGSHAAFSEITSEGLFGGVFAAADENAALSHAPVLHVITSPRPLTDYELNYEIDGAWNTAVEVSGGDEQLADAIMSAKCEFGDMDGWEVQRLRGVLAARLGYTSVEMLDEHGATWLCLPGCRVEVAA